MAENEIALAEISKMNGMRCTVRLRFEAIANLNLITDELRKLKESAERHDCEMRALNLECETAKNETRNTLVEVSKLNGTIANLILITDELSKLKESAERHDSEMRALMCDVRNGEE